MKDIHSHISSAHPDQSKSVVAPLSGCPLPPDLESPKSGSDCSSRITGEATAVGRSAAMPSALATRNTDPSQDCGQKWTECVDTEEPACSQRGLQFFSLSLSLSLYLFLCSSSPTSLKFGLFKNNDWLCLSILWFRQPGGTSLSNVLAGLRQFFHSAGARRAPSGGAAPSWRSGVAVLPQPPPPCRSCGAGSGFLSVS